jgi:hypothetical protein
MVPVSPGVVHSRLNMPFDLQPRNWDRDKFERSIFFIKLCSWPGPSLGLLVFSKLRGSRLVDDSRIWPLRSWS